MPRRWKISPEDAALFREQIGEVRRIHADKVTPVKKRPPPRARFRRAEELQVLEESLASIADTAELGAGDELFFAQPGIDQRVLKRLRRGQFAVGGECDLHGLTVNAARVVVTDFLAECAARDIRCVRIIHGKGLGSGSRGPVIKQHLAAWLRRRADVLAFSSARPADGGTGALYVLLKAR
ncbi:MAG TPA: Smr/MutS family protein [Gammaproteobacteria bacterium]|jgi:DNA-nicking Smr family endonuclease|nr:Smr/MutS family protein [Gammaproteobacteria bacterium]